MCVYDKWRFGRYLFYFVFCLFRYYVDIKDIVRICLDNIGYGVGVRRKGENYYEILLFFLYFWNYYFKL